MASSCASFREMQEIVEERNQALRIPVDDLNHLQRELIRSVSQQRLRVASDRGREYGARERRWQRTLYDETQLSEHRHVLQNGEASTVERDNLHE